MKLKNSQRMKNMGTCKAYLYRLFRLFPPGNEQKLHVFEISFHFPWDLRRQVLLMLYIKCAVTLMASPVFLIHPDFNFK